MYFSFHWLANEMKRFLSFPSHINIVTIALNSLYSNSKPEYILGIVTDSVTLKKISSKKYETIEGFEVNKYSYLNHTIEKIKTIEKPFDWHK